MNLGLHLTNNTLAHKTCLA